MVSAAMSLPMSLMAVIKAAKKRQGIVKYIGTDSTIDELIVLGTMNEKGFAIIRVLGDNMEPAKIMKLGEVVGQINSEENQIIDFLNFFN